MIDSPVLVVPRIIAFVCCVAVLLFLPVKVKADTLQTQKMVVLKAGMVNGFANYTTWPDTMSNRPMVIGVMGASEAFVTALERFIAKKKRPLQVKHFSLQDNIDCQVLVIFGDHQQHSAKILANLKNKPILTISDGSDFIALGGHIGFFSENNRLRFEINYPAVIDSGLKISSRLLGLAKVVGKP